MSLANTIALATIATQASTNASRPSQARLGPSSGGAEATSRPAQTTAGGETPGATQRPAEEAAGAKAPGNLQGPARQAARAAVTSPGPQNGPSARSRPRNR